MNKNFVGFGCAVAMVANSFGVIAQNPVPDKNKLEKREIVITKDITVEKSGSEPADHLMLFTETGGHQAHFSMVGRQDVGQFSYVTSQVNLDGKVVKGQPYSAEIVNEHIQILSDGNRIVRRSTASVARDSAGRTRQESIVQAFGPLAEAMIEVAGHVTIHDPVAGTTFILNPKDKTANKLTSLVIRMKEAAPGASPTIERNIERNIEMGAQRQSGSNLGGNAIRKVQPNYPVAAKAAGVQGAVQVRVTVNETGDVTSVEAASGHPLLREAATDAAKQWKFKQTEVEGKPVKVQGALTFNFTLADGGEKEAKMRVEKAAKEAAVFKVERDWTTADGQRVDLNGQTVRFMADKNYEKKKESLGKQIIEGVECEGTREVTTIPAGDIGNDLPINITTESWYSPELQMTVLKNFNDPRYGVNIHRLTNIIRTEPDKSLFEIPADYKVKEGRSMFFNEKIEKGMDQEMKMRIKEVEEKVIRK